jgi:hypothetical protein
MIALNDPCVEEALGAPITRVRLRFFEIHFVIASPG